jgi:hypothetical protein
MTLVNIKIVLLLVALGLNNYLTALEAIIENFDNLSYDNNSRLSENYILFESNTCSKIAKLWKDFDVKHTRNVIFMNSKIARTFRNNYYESLSSSCRAVCLHKGYHKNDIISTISSQIYSGDMQKWIQQCQSAEFGVVSQHINILNIKAYNVDGTSDSTTLSPADGILWSTTILGTKFDIFDSITNTKLYSVTVSYNQILVVGETPTRPKHQIENLLFHVNNTLQSFFTKPQIVKRTFSELGFKKDKIPDYIWHSIYAFYYNNINNAIREDRENNNYVLNWWESELNLIHIPPVLSTYWHTELRKVAEKWIGGLVPLKNSIIYGLREYTNGARLLTHTDRESTHGIAIIINIAQIDVEKPWYVEMYDFANRLHKVDMEPGDIILYEV